MKHLLIFLTVTFILSCNPSKDLQRTRKIDSKEKLELKNLIAKKFGVVVPDTADFIASEMYRFVSTSQFHYMDRKDLGSLAFELEQYGVLRKELPEDAILKENLLPKIDAKLKELGIDATGKKFAHFLDEYVGSVEQKGLSIDFDPRAASIHVSRTVEFDRFYDGIPIFRSELLVGLMPEGSIGRLRYHWPEIDQKLIEEAKQFQKDVEAQKWKLPESFSRKDIEVLDQTVGIGHSSTADPKFKSVVVMRITYRLSNKDAEYPLSSTGYIYLDRFGKEVIFNNFPEVRGTNPGKKNK